MQSSVLIAQISILNFPFCDGYASGTIVILPVLTTATLGTNSLKKKRGIDRWGYPIVYDSMTHKTRNQPCFLPSILDLYQIFLIDFSYQYCGHRWYQIQESPILEYVTAVIMPMCTFLLSFFAQENVLTSKDVRICIRSERPLNKANGFNQSKTHSCRMSVFLVDCKRQRHESCLCLLQLSFDPLL